MASQVKLTPCGAMFDIFKRAAHLSHIELCGLVLSSRPLADGRSPQSRARRSLLGFPLYRSRAGRHASAALLCRIPVPRLRVLCRNWPCASEIPWTPRL